MILRPSTPETAVISIALFRRYLNLKKEYCKYDQLPSQKIGCWSWNITYFSFYNQSGKNCQFCAGMCYENVAMFFQIPPLVAMFFSKIALFSAKSIQSLPPVSASYFIELSLTLSEILVYCLNEIIKTVNHYKK